MAPLGESVHQNVPITLPPGGTGNRRLHLRKKGLSYVDFGAGNAGIVANLSECGLAFNGIGIVEKGRTFPFRFTMPGRSIFIEATGEVVWLSDSQKSGGLRFVDLAEEVRSEIRAWTSASPVPVDAPEDVPFASAKPSAERPGLQEAAAAKVNGARANGLADSAVTPPKPAADETLYRQPQLQPEEGLPALSNAWRQGEAAKVRFELPESSTEAKGQVLGGVPQPGALPQPPPKAEPEPPKWVVPSAPIKSSQADVEPATSLRRPEIVPDRTAPTSAGNLKGPDSASPQNWNPTEETKQASSSTPTGTSASKAVERTVPTAGSRTLNQMDIVEANPGVQPAALRSSKGLAEQNEKTSPLATTQKPQAPGLTTASSKRTDEQRNNDRAAGLSRAAQQRQIIKNSQLLRFVAGVAVGCVVLATIAGGLVATGRLRLIDPYSAASSNTLPAPDPADSRPGIENTRPSESEQETSAGTLADAASANQPGTIKSTSSATPSSDREMAPVVQQPKPKAPQKLSPSQRPERAANVAKPSPSEGIGSAPVYSTGSNAEKPAGLELPVLISYSDPVYPPAARAANLEGNVEVLATIGRDGVPSSLKLVSGDPQLGAAAIAAISNWRYRPATLNGQFEESLITIEVKFAL